MVLVVNYTVGAWQQGMCLTVLSWMYNDLGGGDEVVSREVILAIAYGLFNSGSLLVTTGLGSRLSPLGLAWTAIVSGVILTTMQIQDLKDQAGDKTRNRRTIVLYYGETFSRVSVAFFVCFWSWICGQFWVSGLPVTVFTTSIAFFISLRVLFLRSPESDARTWKLWCFWHASFRRVRGLGFPHIGIQSSGRVFTISSSHMPDANTKAASSVSAHFAKTTSSVSEQTTRTDRLRTPCYERLPALARAVLEESERQDDKIDTERGAYERDIPSILLPWPFSDAREHRRHRPAPRRIAAQITTQSNDEMSSTSPSPPAPPRDGVNQKLHATLPSPVSERLPHIPETKDEVKADAKAAASGLATQLRSFAAGGFGGVCAVVVGHPFDLVKVRMQTAEKGVYSSAVDVVRKSIARDGLRRGLYAGVSAPLVGVTPMFAVSFWGYDLGKQIVTSMSPPSPTGGLSIAQISAAGFFSAIPMTAITAPFERVKVILQVQGQRLKP
ncbi:hypothetical protein CHU98_g7072, partial [Xylaria longipes]